MASSGTDLLTVVLDASASRRAAGGRRLAPGARAAATRAAWLAALVELGQPVRESCAARGPPRARRGSAPRRARDAAQGLAAMDGLVRPTPPLSINGAIGPHRRWAWARTRLSDVKTVRAALGGTVNDVVLTVITSGFRDLLLSRGEAVEDRVVRTLVPVSVRAPGARGTYDNRVSAMFAELPVGIGHPLERLDSIRPQMDTSRTPSRRWRARCSRRFRVSRRRCCSRWASASPTRARSAT